MLIFLSIWFCNFFLSTTHSKCYTKVSDNAKVVHDNDWKPTTIRTIPVLLQHKMKLSCYLITTYLYDSSFFVIGGRSWAKVNKNFPKEIEKYDTLHRSPIWDRQWNIRKLTSFYNNVKIFFPNKIWRKPLFQPFIINNVLK